jgi:hypothetical protein
MTTRRGDRFPGSTCRRRPRTSATEIDPKPMARSGAASQTGKPSGPCELPRRQRSGLQSPDGSQAPPRSDRAHDSGQHAGQRRAVARRVMLALSPSDDPERRAVAGSCPRAGIRAAHGVHAVRDHRRRRAAEVVREGAMKRPPAKRQSPQSAPAGKQYDAPLIDRGRTGALCAARHTRPTWLSPPLTT